MKAWNKPIRLYYCQATKQITAEGTKPFNPWKEDWGITDWIVGTCKTPWAPWVQINFGRISIQIKWYLVVGSAMLASFIGGLLA